MPRGRQPWTAASTSAGATNAIEMVTAQALQDGLKAYQRGLSLKDLVAAPSQFLQPGALLRYRSFGIGSQFDPCTTVQKGPRPVHGHGPIRRQLGVANRTSTASSAQRSDLAATAASKRKFAALSGQSRKRGPVGGGHSAEPRRPRGPVGASLGDGDRASPTETG
jgi:hypothetical protein